MAGENSVVTLDAVKNTIWDPTEMQSGFDTNLGYYIDGVVGEVETELEMRLVSVTQEVVYRDSGEKWLYMPHANISNVQIWIDPKRLFDPGYLIPSRKYTVDGPRGIIKRHRPSDRLLRGYVALDLPAGDDWWIEDLVTMGLGAFYFDWHGIIKVQYDGGYTPDTLPKDLRRAILQQIAYEFRRRKDPGLTSVTFPDGSINKFSINEFLPSVEKILDRYRRVRV